MPPPKPRHLRSAPGQPRQQIIQLRQLHLQLSFARAGAARENIQDQLRPVQNLAVERALQIAKLGGRQLGIEQNHVGFVEVDQAAQFIQFAGADERGGIRRLPGLHDGLFHARAGGVGQRFQLFERFFGRARAGIGSCGCERDFKSSPTRIARSSLVTAKRLLIPASVLNLRWVPRARGARPSRFR